MAFILVEGILGQTRKLPVLIGKSRAAGSAVVDPNPKISVCIKVGERAGGVKAQLIFGEGPQLPKLAGFRGNGIKLHLGIRFHPAQVPGFSLISFQKGFVNAFHKIVLIERTNG